MTVLAFRRTTGMAQRERTPEFQEGARELLRGVVFAVVFNDMQSGRRLSTERCNRLADSITEAVAEAGLGYPLLLPRSRWLDNRAKRTRLRRQARPAPAGTRTGL